MTTYKDRLYNLVPSIYRIRDSEIGEPLRALLSVISEQVEVVERDIEQLYDNWFIETCDEWTIPYIGDLVGHETIAPTTGDVTDPHIQERNQWLFPRREIANIVRYRRRKGTLPVLEELAYDVAGWPAMAVEMRNQVAGTVNFRALSPTNEPDPELRTGSRLFNFRESQAQARLGGEFNSVPHTPSFRNSSGTAAGAIKPKQIGLWVWQLPVYSMTGTEPGCRVHGGICYFTFNPLGIDTQLYHSPPLRSSGEPQSSDKNEDEPQSTDLLVRAKEFPLPITQSLLKDDTAGGPSEWFYGRGHSISILVKGTAAVACGCPCTQENNDRFTVIPRQMIRVAPLSDGQLAEAVKLFDSHSNAAAIIDPESGRFLLQCQTKLPVCQDSVKLSDIQVTYHYAFSGDLGGGEYRRPRDPQRRAATWTVSPTEGPLRIGLHCPPVVAAEPQKAEGQNDKPPLASSIDRALTELRARLAWLSKRSQQATAEQRHLIIELSETGVYRISEQLDLVIPADTTVEIRAGRQTRSVLICERTGKCSPLPIRVSLHEGSKLVLDGLLIAAEGICISHIHMAPPPPQPQLASCAHGDLDTSRVMLRHCTLVNAHGACCDCKEDHSCHPGCLIIGPGVGHVCIDHSIVGQMTVCSACEPTNGAECVTCAPPAAAVELPGAAPVPMAVPAAAAPATCRPCPPSPVRLQLLDSIITCGVRGSGADPAHSVLHAERSTINGCVKVREVEFVENCIFAGTTEIQRKQIGVLKYSYVSPHGGQGPPRVQCVHVPDGGTVAPDFESVRYGDPGFYRLKRTVVPAIRQGADDGGELGCFHDQFIPHREAALKRRLEEFTPATHTVTELYVALGPT